MNFKYTRIAALLCALLLTAATAAQAMVLWDQSTIGYAAPISIANWKASGFGGGTNHSVDDVTVSGSPWHVTSITEYYATFNTAWTSITQGYLHVYSKTGALPTENPTVDGLVPMTFVITADPNGVATLTASGLNLTLPPGDYWIGITPVATAGINGVNNQWPAATLIGDPVATYDTAWHSYYPGYDGAMKVEGDIPTPTHNTTWGRIKALYH